MGMHFLQGEYSGIACRVLSGSAHLRRFHNLPGDSGAAIVLAGQHACHDELSVAFRLKILYNKCLFRTVT